MPISKHRFSAAIAVAITGCFAAAASVVHGMQLPAWEAASFMSKVDRASRRSYRNGGQGRGAVARSKRAARKRRNIRARAAK